MLARIGRRWYATTSLVLTFCFAALGCLWVNLVPAFESPDESAHFDYAYALASAGGLLRSADGPVGDDPRVATAIRATDLARIAHHHDERVATTFRNVRFRALLRLENDAYRDYSARLPESVRPELASVYPFVPYAVYALAAYPFRNDVLASLYACRFASVALTAIGLLAWSRILRRLRVGKIHSLALLAIVAFFPLTSFVGSYVQPDGVAFAIVSLLLLVTLRIRDGHADIVHGIAYAFLVSILYGSKLQFAFAVGIATIVPVVRAYRRDPSGRKRSKIVASALVAGIGIMYASTRWVMHDDTSSNYFQGPHTLTSAFAQHASSRPLTYLFSGTRDAVTDLFFGGIASRSFWGVFGWLDAPIQIHDSRTTAAFATLETFATEVAGIAFVIALGSSLRRLGRIAWRRSPQTAFRIATNDPAINAYIVFALLIVSLYVVSADAFGAQGRDWFALEVVAFASASWYAVRALPRRWRRQGSAFVLASLALYASIGSVSAITTIEDRYYGPAVSTDYRVP